MRREAVLIRLMTLAGLAGCVGDQQISKHNAAPEAKITSHRDGDTVEVGQAVTFRGQISDEDHGADLLVATWFSGSEVLCAEAPVATDGSTLCDAALGAGDGTIVLEGRDPEADAGTASVALTLVTSEAPTAEITAPEGGQRYYSDQDIAVAAVIADAEDAVGALSAVWTDAGGAVLAINGPDGSGRIEDAIRLSEGAHALTLTVTDSDGKAAVDSVEIEVGGPNQPPQCAITAPADGGSDPSGAVRLEATASDPDQAPETLVVAWESDLDGPLGNSAVDAGGATGLDGALSLGTHRIVARVVDEVGAACEAEILFTVGVPPTVEILAPLLGAVFNEGEEIAFAGTVGSAGYAPELLTVAWESDLDGALNGDPADAAGAVGFLGALSAGPHLVALRATDPDGLYAEAWTEVWINGLPSAPGVSILPGSPGTGDDLAAVIAAASVDPEGDPIAYAYAWYRDGAATGWSTDTVPASETARGEVWSVEVTATDGDGVGPAGLASVVIANTPPTLASADLGPSDAAEGAALTCAAGATADADGDAVALSYAWEVNGLSVAATGSQLGDTWWAAGDSVVCVVTPDDGIDAGAAIRSGAVTIQNSGPTAAGAEISPDPAYAGDALTCAIVGYADADGDLDQSVYSWTVNGSPAGVGDTLSGGFSGGDTVACEVLPFDGNAYGAAVSASLVIENSAPTLASASLTPAIPVEGDTLTCTPGAAADADGDAISYLYRWTVGGTTVAESGPTLSSAEFGRGDSVRCQITPTDGEDDGLAVSSASVIVGNTPPEVLSAAISPAAPTVASTLSVGATTADADGDAVTLSYAWYVNGAMVATTATLSGASFGEGDTVYAVVTPTDGTDSGVALTTAAVTIQNSSPTLTGAIISPDPAYAGDTLTCAGVGYADADGDPDLTTFAWTVNGSPAGSGATLSGAFSGGDTVVCAATPFDGNTSGAPVTDSLTVRNSAPAMTSASLTPATAYEASTLTCAGLGVDADGDALSYTYAWTVNGSVIAPTTSTLTGAYFSKGNTVSCAVTASDGLASSAPLSSSSVTISNTAPATSSVSLTPTTAYEASTLTCAPSSTDADSDAISHTYAWYVNGSVIAPTTSTLSGTYFSRGNTVYCRATASDGAATGSAVSSNTVTISNTAPVASSASLTPTTAYEASTLTCAGAGTDADGDAISYSYAWYVNGSVIAPTTSTLTGTYFSRGDTVYCRPTPTDGTTAGSAISSNSVTVSNTAPTLSSVSLTPTTAYEASTLTCAPSGADADGDTLSYSYAWYVNSSLIAPTTSTLTGTYFSRGNTVYCRVTASDGLTSSSALSSSSVTISNTAPVTSSVSLTPTTAYEGSTLTCAPSSSDADGDAISQTYAWYVNGSAIAPTTSTLTGTYFNKGQTVYCRATPSDSSGAGSAVSSSSVTISNSAPTAPTVAIDPDAPEAGVDDLWCDITTASTDADGDALSYTFAWTRNGSAYTGATTTTRTGDTIPIAALTAGHVWACSATASDGAATSSAGTDSVTVLAASYTLGYYNEFASPGTGSGGANYNLGHQITVPTAVQLYQLGIRMRLASANQGRVALYTNSGGAPGTLVAYTALNNLPAGPVDMDVVGGPLSISAGTYWIMMNFTGTVYMGYTTTGASANTLYYNTLSSSSPFPTTYGSASTYTGQFINLYMVVR